MNTPPSQSDSGNKNLQLDKSDRTFLEKAGCGPLTLVIGVILGGFGWWMYEAFDDDEPSCKSAAAAVANAPSSGCVPPDTTVAVTMTVADSVVEADPTATTIDFAGGAVGSNNTPDGQPATPPSEADLAPGQQLFQGSSGDPIGFIAQDGMFRYLSLERPGVVVGPTGLTSQAMIWPTTGNVISFGVRTSASSNDGRYGFNLFVNGSEYVSGCTLEVGQTSCLFHLRGELTAGDSVVFQIGEAGHLEETGDFTLEWWFVFEPAA